MSYIVPNSQVQLFKNVPLNKDSEDTIYFRNPSEQDAYFKNSVSATFSASNFAFIRKEQQAIRVDAGYHQVYRSNYMRFNNTESGNKWFYAFITDVIYINEGVTEIQYEIDVMQTWLPQHDYFLRQCYVEREHSRTDGLGENLVEENLDLGDTKLAYIDELRFNGNWFAVLISAQDKSWDWSYMRPIAGQTFNMTYDRCPCGYIILLFYGVEGQTNDEDQRGNFSQMVKLFDSSLYQKNIVGCYTIPTDFTSNCIQPIDLEGDIKCYCLFKNENSIPLNRREGTKVTPAVITLNEGSTTGGWLTHIDGYIPRNKKLFSFPYNSICVFDNKGNETTFKIEHFEDPTTIEFRRFGTFTPPVTASIIPRNYNFENGGSDDCPQYRCNLGVSVVGGYTGDMFSANLRQQLPSIISTVGSIVAAPATGGASMIGALQGGASLLTTFTGNNSMTQKTSNPDNIDTANYYSFFQIARKTIRASVAKRIDDFFHAYGYKCDSYKTPNFRVRERWTYTKTRGANHLSKNVPAGDMALINKKFDSGIRFHTSAETIGYTNTYSNGIREV